MTDDLVERLLDWPYQGEGMAHEAAALIEQLVATTEALTAQNFRLSSLCDDLKYEVAVDNALLIGEAEASLERLARAEKAEADNAKLREVVLEADKLLCGDLAGLQWKRDCRSFLVWARAVLNGETRD